MAYKLLIIKLLIIKFLFINFLGVPPPAHHGALARPPSAASPRGALRALARGRGRVFRGFSACVLRTLRTAPPSAARPYTRLRCGSTNTNNS
jgi:hypothetical protein